MITTREATEVLADEAEQLGATSDDDNGAVWAVVARHDLGTLAWFCVCCTLADRQARREGYADALDRAIQLADQRLVQHRLAALGAET